MVVFGPEPVGAVLKRRGFNIESQGQARDILLPLDNNSPLCGEQCNEFRRLFGHPSFRKLVRQITSRGGNAHIYELANIAGASVDAYISFLVEIGVAERSGGEVSLTRQIDNIGPTLEWYVADICDREFEGSSAWSVKLAEYPYNDFDVVSWLPPILVYIETKSSRPSEVTDSELKHFLQRGVDLAPELAILLIDTEDDLEKQSMLARLFELMLPTIRLASGIVDSEWRHDEEPFIAPQPKYPGVNFGYRRFYVTNSKPTIQTQIRKCLRHYHSEIKGSTFLAGDPVNFVTGEPEIA